MIAPLAAAHVPAAAALARRCLGSHASDAAFAAMAFAAANRYFAALDGAGAVVGFGGVSVAADEAEILEIAVDEASRRRGFGRALMEAMLTDAALRGARTVYLEVRASGEAARRLYASLGFCEIGVRRSYYRNPTEDARLMARAADPSEGVPV